MLPTSVRIMVCTQAQDMRRSFDTLALVVRQHLGEDPQSGSLYVFVGKRPTRAKVLWRDRNGYCLHVVVYEGGDILGAIECKVGGSPYDPMQRFKDEFLLLTEGVGTNLVRVPKWPP